MKLDEGACVFGAGVLVRHRQALADEIEKVRKGGKDIDPVHDARVASRRLRATLPLFDNCLPPKEAKKWLKSIRSLTRALGDARDADVQLEWLEKIYQELPEQRYKPGINRLTLRLRQKREKSQAPLIRTTDQLADQNLLDAMKDYLEPIAGKAETTYLYTPALYQHSFQSISERLETFVSYDEIVDQPEKVNELHQMRIAAKWLRYTMETFAPLYADQLKRFLQAVRAAQDLLGEIHDCDVWLAFLPQFLEEERQRTVEYFGHEWPFRRFIPGIQYLEQDRQKNRDELYQKFKCQWQDWQVNSLWGSLRRTIQVPFLQPGDIYPPLSSKPDDKNQVPTSPA